MSAALRRLQETAAQIDAANTAHLQAVSELLQDLAWMGAQVYRIHQPVGRRWKAAIGEVVHILEIWNESDGSFKSEAHARGDCRGPWCEVRGEQRFAKYRRRGERIGFTFRGECVVLKQHDGHLIVSPDISAPQDQLERSTP